MVAARRKRVRTISGIAESFEIRQLLSASSAPIDGVGNNLTTPHWGSAHIELLRLADSQYTDGYSSPTGADRPGARQISNQIVAQQTSKLNERNLTDYAWMWGQFLDHDLDLTESANPAEGFNITVPIGDQHFDPLSTGTATIGLNRSEYAPESTWSDGIRQQVNTITAFIDGSVVYGSDYLRANELRTFNGGRMKTSDGNLMPFNVNGFANAGGNSSTFFLAGDVRANENIALSSMHTIWVREHNRIVDELSQQRPWLTDQELYEHGRSLVAAEIQAITYNEYLPTLLGADALGSYAGYDSSVDPGIANEFSTAAFRFGHSLLSPQLQRIGSNNLPIAQGPIELKNAFFNPSELIETGIDPILRGASSQLAQELDVNVIDAVRNFLFGIPGAGGLDLPSLNIQRGRDHGLADYNSTRVALGLPTVTSFAEITSDSDVAAALESTYGSIDAIDLWVGGLAEDHISGTSMGLTFTTILVDQFQRLRTGDRFWYENIFSGEELAALQTTKLSDVIERNSGVRNLQANIFCAPDIQAVELRFSDLGIRKATVRAVNGQIQIIDQIKKRVVFSRAVDQLAGLVLIGNDLLTDRLTVEGSVTAEMLPAGIRFYGGSVGGDNLTIRGTNGNDSISVDGQDVSLNGLDVYFQNIEQLLLEGLNGNDVIAVNHPCVGITTLDGGNGNDRLIGSSGTDRLFGGAGDDVLYGNDGDDELYGGNGRDQLFGGGGIDLLVGGAGYDLLVQDNVQDSDAAADRLAAFLDQYYSLTTAASDHRNWGGRNERWFYSNLGWMFITPNGNIYQWNRKPGANGALIAKVDAKFHRNLASLCTHSGAFADDDSATSLADLARETDQSLQFRFTGNYFLNWGGRNEKWLRGSLGWYFITSNGRLYKWDGYPGADGELVAEFDAGYYLQPDKLYSAG